MGKQARWNEGIWTKNIGFWNMFTWLLTSDQQGFLLAFAVFFFFSFLFCLFWQNLETRNGLPDTGGEFRVESTFELWDFSDVLKHDNLDPTWPFVCLLHLPPPSAGVFHHRRHSALLLPGCLCLDVSGGVAAVPHAGRYVWERVLTPEILLHLWVPHPGFGGGHLSRHWLQELRHAASVSQPGF